MIFSIGTKVRLIHTGDLGHVKAHLNNGMITVRLADGMEIPVFPEDVVNADEIFVKQPKLKAPNPEEKPLVSSPQPKMQYAILKSMGIQLGFDMKPRPDGIPEFYTLYLINDTPREFLYELDLSFLGKPSIKADGYLKKMSVEEVGKMSYDWLNESPEIFFKCWELTTAGKGKRLEKLVKLKPKNFFSRVIMAPILNKQVHHFKLIESFETGEAQEEDLKTYTLRNARTGSLPDQWENYAVSHDFSEVAHFVPEIDLHIEMLHDDFDKLNNSEKIKVQIAAFDAFIEKAIRLGVPKVFVIHGVGKGKLRDVVTTRLIQIPEVRSFKNEYHPKYGWGATEVDF